MALPYQIIIKDRNYSEWEIYRFDEDVPISSPPNINPRKQKLFSNDVLSKSGDLLHSYGRTETIAGVLILSNNMTYGRTENKKRLLYKCIPNNRELPVFLVAYDLKLGFSKDIKNKYVVFKYEHWDDDEYPRGSLVETLGDVDNLNAFYEYQLYIRNIHHSISEITKRANKIFGESREPTVPLRPLPHESRGVAGGRHPLAAIERILLNPNFTFEERLDAPIYTIDPKGSVDLDDAFGIRNLDDNRVIVSIYIANVFAWIDTFDLWDSLGERVSTIYLPDKRRTMLPAILSDNLCSLLEKSQRLAFCMDVEIANDGAVLNVSYANVLINVRNNYVYEEPRLLRNRDYQRILEVSRKMDTTIADSHDLIEFWMIQMNANCGVFLKQHKTGIFRVCDGIYNPKLPKQIGVSAGLYILYNDCNLKHNLLDVDAYTQISSPIRRLVDIVNMGLFFKEYGLIRNMSASATSFVSAWLAKMNFINVSSKSIRRAQTDCQIMKEVGNLRPLPYDPSLTRAGGSQGEQQPPCWDGLIFNPRDTNDDGTTKYSVYLKDLRLISSVRTRMSLVDGQSVVCRLFLFNDEASMERKVRLELV